VRALGWIIAGHLEHHLRSLRQRYRPGLDPTPGEPGAPGEPRPAADACRVWRAGEAEQVLDREGIQGWRLVREQDRRLIRLHLAAGSALAPHPVPDRALFWLAAGRGRLTVEGRTVELAGGDAALVAAGATRGWEAMTDLDLLVVRGWPED
jgi:quercetin dioxygenase-like cupin family protein